MIDDEVRAIIDKAYTRATELLTTHKDRLMQLAEALVAKETIESDEFAAMFADLPDPRNEPGGSPTPKLGYPMGPGPEKHGAPAGDGETVPEEAKLPSPRQTPGPSPQPA